MKKSVHCIYKLNLLHVISFHVNRVCELSIFTKPTCHKSVLKTGIGIEPDGGLNNVAGTIHLATEAEY